LNILLGRLTRYSDKLGLLAELDARRAYDRVWRDGLLYKLMERGITGKMLRFLASMLSATNRYVAVHGAQSAEFSTTVGLPQGAVLSPLLYAIFINALVDDLAARNLGVEVFGRRVGILLYADDIVLIAESAEQLQSMLDCTSAYATKWQFRFNTKPGKSDVVISPPAASDAQHEFRLADGQLHVSKEYKYLGVEMGTSGQGCWSTYLARAEHKAMAAMHQLAYSVVGGCKPLWVSTSVQLFKALVRPVVEYADAMFGAMCSQAALQMLERVQVRYGRRVLRLQKTIPGEYVRRELGLPSMQQRVWMASLRFFGHLASLGKDRLAGHIFQGRCNNVDAGRGRDSWCAKMRDLLIEVGQRSVWNQRAVPKKWHLEAKKIASTHYQSIGDKKMAERDSMALFNALGAPMKGWLDRTVDHPGAALRFRLRCSGAPLMAVVGGNSDMPMHERTCRMCNQPAIEDAEHFVSKCSYYEKERAECKRRVEQVLAGNVGPKLRKALDENAVELFLGDKLLQEVPADKRHKLDDVLCDYLKVAWRKRDTVWATLTDLRGWKLK
jgi:hypothetical protein